MQSIWIGVGRSIQRRPKFGGQPSVELALGDTLGPDLIDYPGRRLQLLDLPAEVSFECFNGGWEVRRLAGREQLANLICAEPQAAMAPNPDHAREVG